MNVVTHALSVWPFAVSGLATRRDRALVVAAAMLPDLDGIGIVVDFVTRQSAALADTDYYQRFHRVYRHGLPAALAITLLCASLAIERKRVALLAFLAVHLHLLGDLLGSRGMEAESIWPVPYLSPFSDALTLSWSGQWPLVGWQNTSITLAFVVIALWLGIRLGATPTQLFSPRADLRVVAALRARFRSSGA